MSVKSHSASVHFIKKKERQLQQEKITKMYKTKIHVETANTVFIAHSQEAVNKEQKQEQGSNYVIQFGFHFSTSGL